MIAAVLRYGKGRRMILHSPECFTFDGVPGRECPFDLTGRHRADQHTLLSHEAENMGVRAGFLCESDRVELPQTSNLCADTLSVVYLHPCAVSIRDVDDDWTVEMFGHRRAAHR